MKFILTVLIVITTLNINAQPDTLKELQTVNIISTPYEAKMLMPLSWSALDSAAIRKLDYGTDPPGILQRLPGISFTTDNGTNFGYTYFRFRGLDQNRINVTVNGLPLNEPEDAGVYFSNFPSLLSASSNLQLQRGIGLSKFGTPAFVGSLDIETKRAVESYDELGLQFGSFNSMRFYGEGEQGNSKNIFYYKMNAVHTDGYKYHSANTSESAVFQWQHGSGKFQTLYLLLAGNNKNGLGWLGTTDSLIKLDPKTNGNSKDENGNFRQILQQFHINFKLRSNQILHAAIFNNYTKGDYTFDLFNFLHIPSAGSILDYRTHSSFTGISIDHSFSAKNISLSTGINGSLYRKFHKGVDLTANTLKYRNYGNKNELSPFTKIIFRKGKLNLFADLQHRFFTFTYHGDVNLKNFKWNFFNPLFGLGYSFSKYFYGYGNVGNIKREPVRNDIFLGNDNLAKDSTGNAIYSDLLPERNFSTEIGLRYSKDKFTAGFNIYRMEIMNAIDLNGQIGPTGLPLHSNLSKVIRKGAELEMDYQFGNFKVMQNFAYAPHEVKENKVESSPVLTPRVIRFTEINYHRQNLNLFLQLRYQSGSYLDYQNKFSLPPYTVINLIGEYKFRNLTFTAKFMNLLNKVIRGSGQLNVYGVPIYQVQAPFNFIAGVSLRIK